MPQYECEGYIELEDMPHDAMDKIRVTAEDEEDAHEKAKEHWDDTLDNYSILRRVVVTEI